MAGCARGPVRPFYDHTRDAHPRLLFLRPEHPRHLRVAPLLHRLPVHEAQGPGAGPAAAGRRVAGRHGPAADLQRDVRRRSADRRGLRDRLPAGPARDPGARRLDRRDARDRRAGRAPAGGARVRHQVPPPDGPHRLQGRRARSRAAGRARRVHRDLRRRLRAAARLPAADRAVLQRRRGWRSCRRAGATSTRTTRCSRRSRRSCSTATSCSSTAAATASGCFFNFNGTAGVWRRERDRRRRRLAARHADRGSRPELPRAAARLEVPVPARPRDAGRSAGRDERVQVAAAPLGEGLDPDLPQGAAVHPAGRPAAQGEGRGVLPPHGELQLPADDRALGR